MMSRRRRSSRAPVPRLDVEDLLQDIFLRLPPHPSLLPRLSLVCKHWRSILSDPEFLDRFRRHHQNPPLLGFFAGGNYSRNHVFTPVLDPPDRIPAARFPLPWRNSPCEEWNFVDCRHGLAVLINESRREIVVWDPLTDQQRALAFAQELDDDNGKRYRHAAVLCADPEDGHVHGDCLSSPFKVALISVGRMHASACLYKSESHRWGDIVSTTTRDNICLVRPSILAGNTLCWLVGCVILEFDFEREAVRAIEAPAEVWISYTDYWSLQLLRTEDGSLRLAVLSKQKLSIQLWERKLSYDGVASWELLQKTIPLELLFPWRMCSGHERVLMVGCNEDTSVIVLSTVIGDFLLQIEPTQIRKISKRNYMCRKIFYPYTNFYTALLPILHKQQ
ncbi:hypothetical protein VPH35_095882 [Triticum aestivum]